MFWSEEPLAFDPALGVVCICLKTGATVTAACSNFNVCSSITCKFQEIDWSYYLTLKFITFTEAQKFIEMKTRVLNRWSKLSEQKLRFLSKVKIQKNAFNEKLWAYRVYTGCPIDMETPSD